MYMSYVCVIQLILSLKKLSNSIILYHFEMFYIYKLNTSIKATNKSQTSIKLCLKYISIGLTLCITTFYTKIVYSSVT